MYGGGQKRARAQYDSSCINKVAALSLTLSLFLLKRILVQHSAMAPPAGGTAILQHRHESYTPLDAAGRLTDVISAWIVGKDSLRKKKKGEIDLGKIFSTHCTVIILIIFKIIFLRDVQLSSYGEPKIEEYKSTLNISGIMLKNGRFISEMQRDVFNALRRTQFITVLHFKLRVEQMP